MAHNWNNNQGFNPNAPPQQGYGHNQPPGGGMGAYYGGPAPSYFGSAPAANPGGWGSQNAIPPGVNPDVYQWFLAVDSDHSGQINAIELRQALVNGNWSHFNDETCRLMIGLFDRDKNGQINVHEFQALWTYIQQWKGVFEKYDSDRSGFIECQELERAWTEMGYRLSPQFISLIIRRFDRTGRGGITLDSFIQACVQLQGLTESFKARDHQRNGVISVNYEDFLTMVLQNKL